MCKQNNVQNINLDIVLVSLIPFFNSYVMKTDSKKRIRKDDVFISMFSPVQCIDSGGFVFRNNFIATVAYLQNHLTPRSKMAHRMTLRSNAMHFTHGPLLQ